MDPETPSVLSSVPLGSTGLNVSQVGFGGIPIIRLQNNEAERVVRRAQERGITFFDTANAYKDSEDKIGRALQGVRDNVVLATKSFQRDGEGIVEHLENSLRQLRTDCIDLFQLHQISREEEWQEINRPGGAMERLLQARDQGKIRYLGFSSHSLDMALRLIRSGCFATVQFPFNFMEQEAREDLHPAATKAGMGILAMKPFAGGVIDDGPLAFAFLRQYPEVIPLPGFDFPESVDEIISLYAGPNQVRETEQRRMEDYRQKLGQRFCRRCEYCQPCPNGVMITTAMGYPLVASRMSPRTAVEFAREAMETVPLCEECGECEEKCPYELPIVTMIQEHYKLFHSHKAQV
ncbi:MAG: aldo/keto reductase [Desulfohalobiaceae bacterium]|nr:aldo/keto reductase [Desulfohalobiaceae bacterium]